ncbi:MAG: Ribocuclease J [Parcubacteria group bacterium GW2011_GWE2_39_37]|uniref:Ribonuclease J n=1 Tax=Candidatus Falkowbacteria bacterium GW2011_GWF2_39_8 TaxID=1618642 RepID=A0A0G0SE73_9BACT|nr:MAG: Ribocuclease J [Parcubacteria group bacterium GW2011_GWE2_39_37]KKR33015.1 MAG: Ribocuclease J [Candidatus Falkowbacteria bacterium GW2011_GWF2_39_8]
MITKYKSGSANYGANRQKPKTNIKEAAHNSGQAKEDLLASSASRIAQTNYRPTNVRPMQAVKNNNTNAFVQGKLKVMVMGGLEEVGRNMTVIEYDKEIIIIDMGMQFPEEDMPGIDYIIPNISYLEGKEDWIKGVIITHGHMDHIGAIPHLIPALNNPPMFMGKLTAGLVKKQVEKFERNNINLNISEITETSKVQLGRAFSLEFLRVNHSIPDGFAIIVKTPIGTIVHTGDFKIDYSPVNDQPADLNRIALLGSSGILMLMSDSTDSTHPGYQISESSIGDEMSRLLDKIDGRVIIGTFASQLSRVQKIFELAERHGRKICLQGRTMNDNVEVAHQIGYLKFNPNTLITDKELKKFPDNKIIILGTGAQGEGSAFLSKVVNKEHRVIELKPGDTVIFSSSVIPGNERTIQTLKDMIIRQGAKVIHYQMMDVHAGGHAKQEDLKLMMRLVKPEYFMPIEGNHYLLRAHAELAEQVGIPREKIFVADNGQVVEFIKDKTNTTIGRLTNEKVPTEYVMVDGLGVGDVSHVVLRDRRVMSEDGMIVIIATIDNGTGEPIGNPDIISRGFVYMKDNRELIEKTRMRVKKIVKDHDPRTPADDEFIKNKIRNDIGQFLFAQTKRRPMVLPVVIKV